MIELATPRLRLRPFQRRDLAPFAAYRSDPDVARYQGWQAPYTAADAEAFFAAQQEARFGEPGEWLQLAIVPVGAEHLCGDCAVRMVADQPATAEVGVTLAPEGRGRGYATEALGALLAHLFAERGLHRVIAEADDRNVAVHRVLERLAFRCEARFTAADWFKGEWSTLRVYALLDTEWSGRQATAPPDDDPPTSVTLRALRVADAAALTDLYVANRQFLQPFEPPRSDPFFTVEGQHDRLRAAAEAEQAGTQRQFAICDGTEAIVGVVNLGNIVRGAAQSATLGYWVDRAHNGRGIATRAVAAAVEHAFGPLGLHRLQAPVRIDNVASQRVLVKNRFERIGLARSSLFVGGAWRDHLLFHRLPR